MIRRILVIASLFYALSLHAETIDDATFAAVMRIADREGVPRSVAARLMFEESGDPKTGSRGNADAVNNNEPGGFPSIGLFQPWMKPENINYLLELYWYGRGETEIFNPKNPIHSAKLGLRYIADLHRKLKTWYLAACAYNAGIGNVLSGEVAIAPRFTKTRAYARRIVEAGNP